MSSKFLEELAAMKTEESYPKQTARFVVLTDREESVGLRDEEKKELVGLNVMLHLELNRCRLHYQMNWSSMKQGIKDKLAGEVKAWKDRLAGTKKYTRGE